jgi:hypothetical protein
MKNLLNYLPSWKTTKMFLNIIYHVGFIFWFLTKMILIIINDKYLINNNDIFIALIFLIFFVLDIKEEVFNRRNK